MSAQDNPRRSSRSSSDTSGTCRRWVKRTPSAQFACTYARWMAAASSGRTTGSWRFENPQPGELPTRPERCPGGAQPPASLAPDEPDDESLNYPAPPRATAPGRPQEVPTVRLPPAHTRHPGMDRSRTAAQAGTELRGPGRARAQPGPTRGKAAAGPSW